MAPEGESARVGRVSLSAITIYQIGGKGSKLFPSVPKPLF